MSDHQPPAPGRSSGGAPPGLMHDVPLAARTTLGIGGPARFLVEALDARAAIEALAWARRLELPVMVLGGGSNLVVADEGFPGLVVVPALRGIAVTRSGRAVILSVSAGEAWDEVVARAVGEGLAGLECLSGIPGSAGATPVQNVGAYGQEVADSIEAVRVLDRLDLAQHWLPAAACEFGYRSSTFRRAPERWLVLEVRFRLQPGGRPTIAYPELERRLREGIAEPTLGDARAAVLELRRAKSMVLDDPEDPNRHSAGSFFLNPVLEPAEADAVADRAVHLDLVADPDEMPRFPAGQGRVKIPAAWLVESAGFPKGLQRGPVGLSSRHALALVHHGGGTAVELVALAGEIRAAVRRKFGVVLQPEPVFVGFGDRDPLG